MSLMSTPDQFLPEIPAYIQTYFAENISANFVFHDLEHTVQTVSATKSLAEGFNMSDEDSALLQISAWFHDLGYSEGGAGHEERSASLLRSYFENKLDAAQIELMCGCIMATKVPQRPNNLHEQVLCDADLSHLGMNSYWDRTGKIRHEFILTRNMIMNEQDWVDFEINFMLAHEYHTAIAKQMFNKKKAKHIQLLLKQKQRLSPNKAFSVEELAAMKEEDRDTNIQKAVKETETEIDLVRMGRGVETMYRTTYRTHTALSAMADSKANLMLSVNAIVISIIASQLLPQLKNNLDLHILIPTLCLLLTCLGSMIYATLSTRPKITEGIITREAIKKRQANLLFFGNFYNMKLEEFQWGVNEMLKDPEFLYSSMSRDLYFLGKVLAKKYSYLSICYNIFMYGLIISVLAFAISFAV
jgi:predicted metal-dependent HD superfamily phosphohydrolase